MNRLLLPLPLALGALLCTASALPQDVAESKDDDAPTSSLLAKSIADDATQTVDGEPHVLRDHSMFAVAPAKPRRFKKHDIVEIVVRESSRAQSTHETETKKDYNLDGEVKAWPDLSLHDILNLQAYAGRSTGLPSVDVRVKKEFEGEGDYKREDDFTARLAAEVIDVLPNANLVLEARTFIKTDEEEASIKVTGICRPGDVSASNTILSNQIHDLKIEKVHKGQLKQTNEKGLLAKIFDTIFAF